MIRIENLTKVYEAKKGKPCLALDGVSFSLPDRGMVFVVGKSGSGKSTLLNLLGGLDGATGGDIEVGGKRFSEFSEADYDDYRNSFLGFVFQDFCLLEGMTVYENVRLSLDLLGEESEERVRAVLQTVELEECGGRYPKELSGGQKQRVALARALIKDPRMILADEPTGNLDRKTARQVLHTLKELARDRLVVIVSHSTEDADEYADRVIELSDGRVVRDVSRNPEADAPLLHEGIVTLPTKRRLREEELLLVNEAVRGGAEIRQSPEEFIPTEKARIEAGEAYCSLRRNMPLRRQLRLGLRLSKGNRFASLLVVLMVSFLIILLSVCRLFGLFDGERLLGESIKENPTYSFSLYKGYREAEGTTLSTDKQVEVTDADIEAFREAGYTGNAYKLYNVSLALRERSARSFELGGQIDYSDTNTPYLDIGGGVLECDEAFLAGLYGDENGALTVLAGDINEETPRAIIITDYFADCIMAYDRRMKSYADIVDAVLVGYAHFDVKAVVSTGYADRHAEMLAEYTRILSLKQEERRAALEALKKDERFLAFYKEAKEYLAIGYYLGDDYEKTEIAYVQSRYRTCFDNPVLLAGNLRYEEAQWPYTPDAALRKGEIRMPIMTYNRMMGTDYTVEEAAQIEPFEITLLDYPYHSDEGAPVYQRTFTVVGVGANAQYSFSYTDYLELYAVHFYPIALYFDNAESAAGLYMEMKDGADTVFFSEDSYFKAVYTVMDIVSVFDEFFFLLYVGLVAISALLFIGFARRSVRRRMYEIGVLRALGGRNTAIARLFTHNLLVMAAFVTLLSLIGDILLIPYLNEVFVDNLAEILDTLPIRELKVLQFNLLSAAIDLVTILLLSLLSSFGSLYFCRRIKPIAIIRNKE